MQKVVKVTSAQVRAARELVRRYELGIDPEDPGPAIRWVANARRPTPPDTASAEPGGSESG